MLLFLRGTVALYKVLLDCFVYHHLSLSLSLSHTHTHRFLEGYCSTLQGLLDRFEVDPKIWVSVLQCVAVCCSDPRFGSTSTDLR